jgi:hypothetical protein
MASENVHDLFPGFLSMAYIYMVETSDFLAQRWSKTVTNVPINESQQIKLLDA